jgi:hypothetical protein
LAASLVLAPFHPRSLLNFIADGTEELAPHYADRERYVCGERIVASAREFRALADECMEWAKTAKSDRERAIFLQMAQTWLQAAMLRESRHVTFDAAQLPVQAK